MVLEESKARQRGGNSSGGQGGDFGAAGLGVCVRVVCVCAFCPCVRVLLQDSAGLNSRGTASEYLPGMLKAGETVPSLTLSLLTTLAVSPSTPGPRQATEIQPRCRCVVPRDPAEGFVSVSFRCVALRGARGTNSEERSARGRGRARGKGKGHWALGVSECGRVELLWRGGGTTDTGPGTRPATKYTVPWWAMMNPRRPSQEPSTIQAGLLPSQTCPPGVWISIFYPPSSTLLFHCRP